MLASNDECVHTATLEREVPLGMEVTFLIRCIEDCIDVESANLCLKSTGYIELTLTGRGSQNSVRGMALSILSRGFARAKGIISASQFEL